MPRKLRQPGEQPVELIPDKAHFPLHCNGNGHRACQSHAPACAVAIPHGSPFFTARWNSEPHLTVHCRACRDHFFGRQRKLGL